MRTTTTGMELDGLTRARNPQQNLEASHESVKSRAGEMIRSWRSRMGITQETLARALGVTLSTLNRWENNRGLPSQLAWREMKGLAARHGRPL